MGLVCRRDNSVTTIIRSGISVAIWRFHIREHSTITSYWTNSMNCNGHLKVFQG